MHQKTFCFNICEDNTLIIFYGIMLDNPRVKTADPNESSMQVCACRQVLSSVPSLFISLGLVVGTGVAPQFWKHICSWLQAGACACYHEPCDCPPAYHRGMAQLRCNNADVGRSSACSRRAVASVSCMETAKEGDFIEGDDSYASWHLLIVTPPPSVRSARSLSYCGAPSKERRPGHGGV